MSACDVNTQEMILNAGKREFLEKGFREASLRRIVKEAGVTTGAFYGYYKSKEELFDALVAEQAQVFLSCFNRAQDEFANLPPEQQPDSMGQISGDCMLWMVDYMYAHYDAFKLLLCCSDGTKYESFIHTLVQIEMDATHRFLKVLEKLGRQPKQIDEQLEHILVSGFFSGFFEIIVHDMQKDKAVEYVKELRDFYTAGWAKIMGL